MVNFLAGNDLKLSCSLNITIHMPQRTSKILLVRLTANENSYYSKYALRVLLVTLCDLASDQNTVNDFFTLSAITYFEWFPLKTRRRKLIVLHFNMVHILTGIHFGKVCKLVILIRIYDYGIK